MIEEIERLGDLIGDLTELSNSLYNEIKKKYGINTNTIGIWQIKIRLDTISAHYTKFHKWIFKEMESEKNE